MSARPACGSEIPEPDGPIVPVAAGLPSGLRKRTQHPLQRDCVSWSMAEESGVLQHQLIKTKGDRESLKTGSASLSHSVSESDKAVERLCEQIFPNILALRHSSHRIANRFFCHARGKSKSLDDEDPRKFGMPRRSPGVAEESSACNAAAAPRAPDESHECRRDFVLARIRFPFVSAYCQRRRSDAGNVRATWARNRRHLASGAAMFLSAPKFTPLSHVADCL